MRIRCLQGELSRALSAVARATTPRTPLPILNSVLLETTPDGLRVTATDLELAIRLRVPAEVDRPGCAALPARLLAEVASHLPPAPVELDAAKGGVKITCEKASFELATLAAEDFPQVLDVSRAERVCSIPTPLLRSLIRRTAFAASKDERRMMLTGVHLIAEGDVLELAATDGMRLAICRTAALLDRPIKATIPARALHELARLLGGPDAGEVEIGLADRQITFAAGGLQLSSRLLDGRFPDYQHVIPTQFAQQVRVKTDQLSVALQRVAATARDDATTVRLLASGKSLRLASSTPDVGRGYEEVDASSEGEPVEVAFNARLLLEGLAAAQAEEATLALSGPASPAVLKPVGPDDWTYVLAPVRVAS